MIAGRYQDTIVRAGRRTLLPWRSNLVVSSCYEIVAALMKGQPGTTGVLWWAVGAGDPGWGSAPPAPRADDRGLVREIARQPVRPEHIGFVDESGQWVPGPTRRLEVRGGFVADRLGSGTILREFGLFGGSAMALRLINRVTHPGLELQPGDILERRVQLTFGVAMAETATWGPFGARLPVRRIKGIDELYADAFRAGGIETVEQLAGLGEADRPAAVPPSRFREVVEKAVAVRSFRPLSMLETLFELTVLGVLEAQPSELGHASGGALDEAAATDAQHSLRILQVVLDAELLGRLTVRQLFSGE